MLSCHLFLDSLTSSLVPLLPWPSTPTEKPTLEVEEFTPQNGHVAHPNTTYTNNLYVYPINLKYDSQKTYTKVRCWIVVFHRALNLVCTCSTCKNDTLAHLNAIYKQPLCISHQLEVRQSEDVYKGKVLNCGIPQGSKLGLYMFHMQEWHTGTS